MAQLHPQTFTFLSDLRDNNHKAWFDTQRDLYQHIRKALVPVVQEIIAGTAETDPTIASSDASKSLFRINRDIRFSNDKSPYKTNMGAWFAPGGKQSVMAGYYLHLEPGGCFLAGGSYMPMAPELKKIRAHIDYDYKTLQKIADEPAFAQAFGQITGDSLSSMPKGYAKDHPAAAFLRLKSFTVSHPIGDELALSPALPGYAVQVFATMHPLIAFLNEGLAFEE